MLIKKLGNRKYKKILKCEKNKLCSIKFGNFEFSGNSPPVRIGMRAISRQAGTEMGSHLYY